MLTVSRDNVYRFTGTNLNKSEAEREKEREEFRKSESDGLREAQKFSLSLQTSCIWRKINLLVREHSSVYQNGGNTHYLNGLSKVIKQLESTQERVFKIGDKVLVSEKTGYIKGEILEFCDRFNHSFLVKPNDNQYKEIAYYPMSIMFPYEEDKEKQLAVIHEWVDKGYMLEERLPFVLERLSKRGFIPTVKEKRKKKVEKTSSNPTQELQPVAAIITNMFEDNEKVEQTSPEPKQEMKPVAAMSENPTENSETKKNSKKAASTRNKKSTKTRKTGFKQLNIYELLEVAPV